MRRSFNVSYRNRLFLDVSLFNLPKLSLKSKENKLVIPIILCNFGVLSKEEVEAGRRFLRRSFGKTVRVEVVIKAFLPQTKKPAEVRMGKGKGKISSWVAPIRAGQIIYNLHGFLPFKKVHTVINELSKKFSKNLWVLETAFFASSSHKLCKREFQLFSSVKK